MRIGVDIDGVLFPWDLVAREVLDHRYGDVSQEPSTSWNALKEEVSGKAWSWLWSSEGQAEVFGRVGYCYPDAVLAINHLMGEGHEVHFVTHRDPRRTCRETAEFLSTHFPHRTWAGVHLVKSATAKRTLGRWDAFVDDKPETIWDFISHSPGTSLFCPRREWNMGDLYGEPGFTHYQDAMEIVRALDEVGEC